jgi:streptogramin lyase
MTTDRRPSLSDASIERALAFRAPHGPDDQLLAEIVSGAGRTPQQRTWRSVLDVLRVGSRLTLIWVVLALAVALATGVLLAGGRGPDRPVLAIVATPLPTDSAAPATASAVPPASPALPAGVLAEIQLDPGAAPTSVASGFGSVWVSSERGTTLYRIDPVSNAIVARIDVGQRACGELTIGFGRVWVPPCDDNSKVVAVDPLTNTVVGGYEGGYVAVATSDAIWGGDGTVGLVKIDPRSYRVLKTAVPFPLGLTADNVIDVAGSLWVTSEDPSTGAWGGTIVRIDPATGAVVRRVIVPLPTSTSGVYVASLGGDLWLKGNDSGLLERVDLVSGAVTQFPLPGYGGLSQFNDIPAAAGLGSIWVRLASDAVSRVDPATGTVTGTSPADPAAGGGFPAVAFGSLWIANFGTATVWRDRIAP